jgi:hypothetical protein
MTLIQMVRRALHSYQVTALESEAAHMRGRAIAAAKHAQHARRKAAHHEEQIRIIDARAMARMGRRGLLQALLDR